MYYQDYGRLIGLLKLRKFLLNYKIKEDFSSHSKRYLISNVFIS